MCHIHRTPADRGVESSGNEQKRVAHGFQVEAAPWKAPEQAVLGIDLCTGSSRREEALFFLEGIVVEPPTPKIARPGSAGILAGDVGDDATRRQGCRRPQASYPPWRIKFKGTYAGCHGSLLIRAAQDNHALEVFHAPAGADKLRRQPVKQLGIRRGFAPGAEIGCGSDQRLAEVVHPDPVHEHPRGERIGPGGNGLGQLKPATAMNKRPGFTASEQTQKCALGRRAGPGRIAAQEHVRLIRLR